jgi:hypothetical protein
MLNPAPQDIMTSQVAIVELVNAGHPDAIGLLMDLFIIHRRRPFRSDRQTLAQTFTRWRGPWAKRRFDASLQILKQAGYIKEMPNGQSRITSKRILTGSEYLAIYCR